MLCRMVHSCTPAVEGGKVVLITGAAGFVGFHSALQLHARGDAVLGLDNFNDYYDVRLKFNRESILREKGTGKMPMATVPLLLWLQHVRRHG